MLNMPTKNGSWRCPDVLDRIELRRPGRQQDWRDVGRHDELAGCVPGRTIHDEHGMRAIGDIAGYFIDMRLHGFSVHPWRCDSRTRSTRRANRPEQIGVFVALISRLAWPRPGFRPLTDDSVLLADPGFILEPDFNRRCLRHALKMCAQRAREVFLNASTISPCCAGCLGRALMWEKPSFFRSVPMYRSQ